MPHRLSGIITDFKYTGELPHIILVGNYYFIPFQKSYKLNYSVEVISPYRQLTPETKKLLKELSFKGKCSYIETAYFGGSGSQIAETWKDGKRILGPLISFDGIHEKTTDAVLVENAINENLKEIGIYRHTDLDEFDSVRLSHYRSNEEVIEEYTHTYKA